MALVVVVLIVGIAVAGGAGVPEVPRTPGADPGGHGARAGRFGFTFSLDDVDRVVDMPFGLFSKGEKRAVELVISGEHNGVPMRMFDYWYYDETSDSQGNRSRTYHRFTCGMVTIPAACPRLRLGHENFMTRLGDHLGTARRRVRIRRLQPSVPGEVRRSEVRRSRCSTGR